MRKLKKGLGVLLAIVALLCISALIFLNTLTPTYEGEKELNALSGEVEVYFDTYGIPHIYAENEMDALRTLGYVHAQDRLWQMELLRRAGTGRLSEVFGEIALDTDKFFLVLGIDENTKKTLAGSKLSDPVKTSAKAYLDGINQFIAEGPTPVEFYLTGLEKEPFQLEDVLNSVAYMGFTFNKGARDIINTNLLQKLDTVYTQELFRETPHKEVVLPNTNTPDFENALEIAKNISSIMEQLPVPVFYGSNSWVLAPEKTANGKVLFENDPHIAQAQPSVWYESHIITPDYEKYGYYLAGVPFPLLSHNRKMAHGLTMLANDDTNFYYEEVHPTDTTLYRDGEEWRKFEYVKKTIGIKEGKTVDFTFKKTHRGPIMNANYANRTRIKGERLVSMHWLFTQFDNTLLQGLYGINHADNIAEFEAALPNIHAPGLNVMYGDASGNVAWWGTAKLYQMPEGVGTKLILDGASGKEDPLAYLDFANNPRCINPSWNYVYSANNQPDSTQGRYLPGYFANSRYRAGRIVDLMKEKPTGWTKEDMANMANDVYLRTATGQMTNWMDHLDMALLSEQQEALVDVLRNWDGQYDLNSVGGVFFEKMEGKLHQHIFADEFSSPEEYRSYLGPLKMHKMFDNPASVWWDDVTTTEIQETKSQIINNAFQASWEALNEQLGGDFQTWTWDRVHFLEHGHPIGRVAALRRFFNVGPFPTPGTGETLNNQGFRTAEDGSYQVINIPSTRRIIDFSDIENSISILPTGQSGNPLSKHYKDQAEMYVKGEFRKMMMNRSEIQNTSENLLVFKPKN